MMSTSARTKLHHLALAAKELAQKMAEFDSDTADPREARREVMSLIHAVNYTYVLLADEVDTAAVWVVD